ncbi:MAG: FAD-dependent oxidoreductase [Candidatus Woesearchaeota archaeon]|nr:FAD-dependent oxidoreductase [Candidatus Woesearchaeota archaeon]
MYDTLIIGAGVTGYGAAMYAGRLGLKALLVGELPGGTITMTDRVENYPGFSKLTGQELADNLRKHAEDYKEFIDFRDDRVASLERKDNHFIAEIGKEKIEAKTVIFATGTKWRELRVPGHDEFKNKGVHYCALCDGFFYRNKDVAIVGGSDSAAKDALVLAEHAKKVYIIYRKEKIRPEPPNMKRIEKNGKIEIINNANVLEIKGDKSGVTSVMLDRDFNGSKELRLDGLFIAIGHIALSELAKSIGVELNEKGEIKINRKSETNIPGFFAAGDVVDTHFKQAITGVAEGVLAAYGAYEYVKNNEG